MPLSCCNQVQRYKKRSGHYHLRNACPRRIAPRATLHDRLAYDARILQVLSRAEFRLKYAGSLLGYLWSLAKPLMYFTVLWIVFGNLFKLGIHLGELWHLTPLAEWLRAHGRYRFLLTAPPLRLPGATGSPATPVAAV